MRMLLISLLMAVGTADVAGSAPESLSPHGQWPVHALPMDPPRTDTLTLRQIWRLDGGEDAETVLGQVVSAAPGLDGRVLVCDAQLTQVLVVAPTGLVERTLGRKGDGPGDWEGAWRAVQLADGRIGAIGGAPAWTIQVGVRGRLVLLGIDGEPADTWRIGGDTGGMPTCSVRDLRCRGAFAAAATHAALPSPPNISMVDELVLLQAPNGARTVVARQVRTSPLSSPTIHEQDAFEPFAEGRMDLDANGRLAWAPERDAWRIAIREPDGTGLVLERPLRPVRRSDAETRDTLRRLGGGEYGTALPDHPLVGRVRWRPDGSLWVEPMGVEPAPGAMACFDEVSAAGELLRRVHLRIPEARSGDELVLTEDGRFVLLRGWTALSEDEVKRSGDAPEPAVILLQL